MKRVGNISKYLGQGWLVGFSLLLISYFAYHTFQGDNSLARLQELKAQEIELAYLSHQSSSSRSRLAQRINAMQAFDVDPDMLEEQVREKLGFTHPDEVVFLVQ